MDKDTKALTAVRKRQQIQNANRAMLIWVAAASAIVTVCIVLGYNFTQTLMYNNKVISAKNQTNKILKDNISTIDELKQNVNKLQTDRNLIALKASPDDTAFQVVIDALPTEDDRTALASSLQGRILAQSGVSIEQVSVTESTSSYNTGATADTGASDDSLAQVINFNFVIGGDYASIQKAVQDIERTIRPINITSMTVQGVANQLQATVNATTFYVPAVIFQLGSKEVQP